jgi:hypothetical protein
MKKYHNRQRGSIATVNPAIFRGVEAEPEVAGGVHGDIRRDDGVNGFVRGRRGLEVKEIKQTSVYGAV